MMPPHSSRPPLFDIAVNLTHRRFRADLDALLERARAAGVPRMLVVGLNEAKSAEAATLAASRPDMLVATAGVHPHDAKTASPQLQARLRELAAKPEVVAIGECGLDFDRDFSPRPVQEEIFEAQLEVAAQLGLPVYLHERAAHTRWVELFRPWRERLVGGVLHCFTGSAAELRAYLELDLHIGITGWICDERRGSHLREIIGEIPRDRLMIETDAPFLLPRSIKPKPKKGRNEPAFLPYVLTAVAAARGEREDEVAAFTTANAERLFRIPAAVG